MSLSDRKEFADSAGRPLFSLRTRHFTIHKTFYAEAPDGRELFEVKGKFSIGTSKMIATFTNTASTNAPVELVVKGDWFDRSAMITLGDQVVAQIARKLLNMREIFGGQQTVSSSLFLSLEMKANLCRIVLRDCGSRCGSQLNCCHLCLLGREGEREVSVKGIMRSLAYHMRIPV